MEKIAIISDVNAGLDYLSWDPEIPVLRSIINFEHEHLIDGIDIRAEEFYRRLQQDSFIPSTSAPTVGEAMELLEKLVTEGYTDVIMYSISYQLSSIGQMLETLREDFEGRLNIHVIDTKTAGYMQGYLAVTAKTMAKAGNSVSEIMDRSHHLINHGHAYFVVDDLNYLVKNGRISGAAGFLGGLMRIKPVLEINKIGQIVSFEKVRTHHGAVERIKQLVLEEVADSKHLIVFIFHTVREQDAIGLSQELNELIKTKKTIEIHVITPAVGAHIGCGILGIGYYKLDK
ncbi:MAG: DegV family protein [Bacilli bacterium]